MPQPPWNLADQLTLFKPCGGILCPSQYCQPPPPDSKCYLHLWIWKNSWKILIGGMQFCDCHPSTSQLLSANPFKILYLCLIPLYFLEKSKTIFLSFFLSVCLSGKVLKTVTRFCSTGSLVSPLEFYQDTATTNKRPISRLVAMDALSYFLVI